MAVGRISGPLLKDNLLRNGVNLAFETNLLYLDVVNSRVGINTAAPTNDLSVNGTTRTTNLYISNSATIGNITVSSSTISSTSGTITLSPSGLNATVYQGTAQVGNLQISGNTIVSTDTNGSVNITANGNGLINLNNNTLVSGNLHATGNITADGNITLGSNSGDTVAFDGEVNSNILPNATNTHDLGSSTLAWNNIWVQTANITNLNTTNVTVPSFTTSGTPSLTISGNTITANSINTNVNFVTSGTGGVQLGNLLFSGSTITNTASNAVTTFNESGAGYFQIAGTYGVVIPSGSSAQRPAQRYETLGMTRFNTDLGLVEVWNGTYWVNAGGPLTGVTANRAQDIGVETALALG